uniref:Na(+)/H(+) exchange regulatory cofactor NHE-RF1 n=1 Tax=Naja naja TaxID=35670 RepID=A0A8C6X9Q1_NAJNA
LLSPEWNEPRLLPRLCCPEKGPNGYGFHLHGEKSKTGQFIRLVEPDSPAEQSGLKAGDRLIEVNGDNVEKESHQQVVNRIRNSPGSVRLLVVDSETDQHLQQLGLQCREEFIRGLPEKPEPWPGGICPGSPGVPKELRPRLCQMKKGPSGYGFNLHSDKTKPGQYVRAVDPDSPAEASGLQPQDRIIEVNGQCMEGKQHSDVVSAIKSGGDETKLLVVDSLTDEFFKKCKIIPSEAHLKGMSPVPSVGGERCGVAIGVLTIKQTISTCLGHQAQRGHHKVENMTSFVQYVQRRGAQDLSVLRAAVRLNPSLTDLTGNKTGISYPFKH